MTDFSCVAVPMLVPAKKDGKTLASHTFSELYQLFLIPVYSFFCRQKPYINWQITFDTFYAWSF